MNASRRRSLQAAGSGGLGVGSPPALPLWKGTRLSTLLLVHPQALHALLALGPGAAWLADPQARQLRAHRLTLADVAHQTGRSLEDVIGALQSAMEGKGGRAGPAP